MSYTTTKNVPDLKLVEETWERQGTKRKPSQLQTGDNTGKPASVPFKKAKTTKEPPRSTSAHRQEPPR